MKNLVNLNKMSDNELKALQEQIIIQRMDTLASGLERVTSDIGDLRQEVKNYNNDLPLLGVECDKITNAVRKKGVECLGGKKSEAYKDRSVRMKVYSDIYGQLKREFGVASYKAIKRSQADCAVGFVSSYMMPMALSEIVDACNSQITMEQAV